MDVRHEKRTKIVQELYAITYNNDQSGNKLDPKTFLILQSQKKLNIAIKEYASKFPLEKIARVDLAILQMSVYDLLIEKKEPPKVVINEAVDLARELGSDRSFAFINAILGKIYQDNFELDKKNE